MRCRWRILIWAVIAAAFLRPFVQRASWWQQQHNGQQVSAAQSERVIPSKTLKDREPVVPADRATTAAAAVATTTPQEEVEEPTIAAAAAVSAASRAVTARESRSPARWGPDRNDWWEDGLALVPRHPTTEPATSIRNQHIDILVVVLSGRSAKYAARRETIRSTWSADVAAHATKHKVFLKIVFAISDNFCGYDPGSLPLSTTSFPAARCKQAQEHRAGGQVSDEHSSLLREYRRNKDIVFVPRTIDAYYNSATKMRTFYKCLIEAKVSFGILIKLDDDGMILRKPFFEHYSKIREIMDPLPTDRATATTTIEAGVGPRWWGHFNEWWAPVRAEDEAAEISARLTRSEHNWFVTVQEWPYHWFPTFAIGTGHALNYAAVECFARLTSHRSTARPQAGGSDSGGNLIDAGTAVWMEDVAHGVWFDVCAADFDKKRRSNTGGGKHTIGTDTPTQVQQTEQGRACRLFDWRWVKGPGADACRPDAHAIGSIGSRSAQQHTAKLGRTGKCPCTSEGGSACSENSEDVSKFHSQLFASEKAERVRQTGRDDEQSSWLWPFLRCGTSAEVMMDAKLMVFNSSTAANDDSRWPQLASLVPDNSSDGDNSARKGLDTLNGRLCTIERECVLMTDVFDPT